MGVALMIISAGLMVTFFLVGIIGPRVWLRYGYRCTGCGQRGHSWHGIEGQLDATVYRCRHCGSLVALCGG